MRKASWIAAIVVGALLIVGGAATWWVVSDTLAAQQITVSADADCLAGDEVNGPFSAYCEAKVIEKHFTFSRRMYGSDARNSMEPEEFAGMVRGVRAIEAGCQEVGSLAGVEIVDRLAVEEALELTSTAHLAERSMTTLSGGERQRVSIAAALAQGGTILLLDEPFGALDEFTRERMNIELLRIVDQFKATSLFVTHNITEAIFLADKVCVMTPRPGRLAKIIDVPFPRPREIDIEVTPEFNEIVAEVREVLGGDH